MSSKNIILEGATYNGVESITLSTSGGGSATFNEVSDTTAIAEDVASGKFFYNALGVLTEGTASGGGGSSYTLLGSAEFSVSTSSKTETDVGTISCGADAYTKNKLIYVSVRRKEGKMNGFYGTDCFFSNSYAATGATSDCTFCAIKSYRWNAFTSQWYHMGWATNAYGVCASAITSNGDVLIKARYNSSGTSTINGTFVVKVYALDWVDDISPYNM